jgi:hypothetical protein
MKCKTNASAFPVLNSQQQQPRTEAIRENISKYLGYGLDGLASIYDIARFFSSP